MNLIIKKIKLKELESFVKSNTFKAFETKPTTDLRVVSYLKNPAANNGDYVMYLGFIGEKLVAFRTIFAGQINSTRLTRFGWCSGNWVHPDYRRKGYSEQLLNEALADWNYRLMFTNYAPSSESLYLKTGRFHAIHQFQGARCYLFPKTKKLASSSNKNQLSSLLYSSIDVVLSIISKFRTRLYTYNPTSDTRFEKLQILDKSCIELLEKNQSKSFFKRGIAELEWIFQYPWMTNKIEDYSEKYPFSSYANDFEYLIVKILNKKEFCGFFIFSIKNKQLKTLHFEIKQDYNITVVNYLKKYCIEQKIEVLTIYNSGIAKAFLNQKFPFLHVKSYGQKIYSSFELENKQSSTFQDGDGDVIFT